jgi:nucleotide-binding universal stress UspA family protein
MLSTNKNLLIAIDLSENSLHALDYVGEMVSCHPSVHFTLLHVIKEPSPDIMPSEEERSRQVESMRSEALGLMEKAANQLISRGVSEKHIKVKIQICKAPVSVSDLILHEQQSGDDGTIVIGRRGLSKREEFLFGSVSSKIIREARHCAVWVVE